MIQGIRYITTAQIDNSFPLLTVDVAAQWANIRTYGKLLDDTKLTYAELVEGPNLDSVTNAVFFRSEYVIFTWDGDTLQSRAINQNGVAEALVAAGGGGGAVDSVFGRTGAVVATAGDYAVADITGLTAALAAKADDSDVTDLAAAVDAAFVHNTGTESIGGAKTFTSTISGNLSGNVTGNLTGNVTGNLSGDVTGSLVGNADTATKLATARNIQGVAFDGSAPITVLTLKTGGVSNSDQNNLDIVAGTGIGIANVAGVTTITNTGGSGAPDILATQVFG